MCPVWLEKSAIRRENGIYNLPFFGDYRLQMTKKNKMVIGHEEQIMMNCMKNTVEDILDTT